ncbi:hypothetical protein [Sphingomonas sp. MMS24-J13]|uniref:hypothetical protein n=1 Tax=Sphingomonas sp. MMS24-J13 TaxID=3238686 RepID=UPI00384F2C7F
MVKVALVLTTILIAIPAYADHTPPSQLILKVKGLSGKDVAVGQKYATCVRTPWLPTEEQWALKAKACEPSGPIASSGLKAAMEWVDHIAHEFPGAEIDLRIRRR